MIELTWYRTTSGVALRVAMGEDCKSGCDRCFIGESVYVRAHRTLICEACAVRCKAVLWRDYVDLDRSSCEIHKVDCNPNIREVHKRHGVPVVTLEEDELVSRIFGDKEG